MMVAIVNTMLKMVIGFMSLAPFRLGAAEALTPPPDVPLPVPLPARQQPLDPFADGRLFVDPGTDVLTVERSQHIVGMHERTQFGTATALPLGRGHHGGANWGAAHGVLNSNNVTFRYHGCRAERKLSRGPHLSQNVTLVQPGQSGARRWANSDRPLTSTASPSRRRRGS